MGSFASVSTRWFNNHSEVQRFWQKTQIWRKKVNSVIIQAPPLPQPVLKTVNHHKKVCWPGNYKVRTVYSGSFWIRTLICKPALATEANRSVLILLHRPHFSFCPSLICPSLICTLIMTDRCVAHSCKYTRTKKTCSDTPTLPQMRICKGFFFMSGPSKESDATATSTGTLRQHLHSRPDLNDHSSQWENFNGAPGRKEAASLLILGTVHLRWNAGKGREEAWRGRKVLCLSLSRLSASCLFLTIITPCIRYERESHSSLILWIISPSLPVPSPASPFLPFSDSLFHSHLPPLLLVPE